MSAARRVAVIGAGVAGLTAARRLAAGVEVVVFEKSRGPGGRLAHRRADDFAFDFGAQYFTVRHEDFRAEVAGLVDRGIVAPWQYRFAEIEGSRVTVRGPDTDRPVRYAGVGKMTAMASFWAEGLVIERMTRIVALRRLPEGWVLSDETGADHGPFDFVVVAIPSPQAATILPARSPLQRLAQETAMSGCFALMLGFDALPDPGYDAARFTQSPLSWLAFSRARPGAAKAEGLVALSDNRWAERHIDAPVETVKAQMMEALAPLIGGAPAPRHVDLHRWRYADCARRTARAPLVDAPNRLAACGDWTRAGRVEDAYLSGLRTAERVEAILNLEDGLGPSVENLVE